MKLPIYSGFLHIANGPAVTSPESLVMYPADQMRIASPTITKGIPIQHARGVGFANSTNTIENDSIKNVRFLNR